jgi:nitroimidazol reductase NimA-like FMN-containing flavoprotein (pyridoxamine 5'-phosphate oxidase superfamily)
MRRRERRLSDAGTLELLRGGEWGVLSLAGDGAYGVPVNYVLDDAGGNPWPDIFFHCAGEGAKLDAMRRNPGVCFTVVRKAEVLAGRFSIAYASVIVKADAECVGDEAERYRVLRLLGHRFSFGKASAEAVDAYIAPRLARTKVIRLRPREVCGKANV